MSPEVSFYPFLRVFAKKPASPSIKRFKLKKLIPQSRQVQVKKNGQIVRTMRVRKKAYYFNGNTRSIY